MPTKPKPAQVPLPPANGVSEREVLTLAEAAALLRVPEDGLRREADAGRIPGQMIGEEWRFSRQAVLDWLSYPRRPSLADWFRQHPPAPWSPEVEREAEEEIARLHAIRKSLGTVGDMEGEGEAR